MRVDGYVRVSRVGGRAGESFISPAEQRSRIRSWTDAHGFELVQVHEDLDQPGSRADRPGLAKAMKRIERGTVKGLVVYRLNRFGRSNADNARLIQELRTADGALFTVSEGIDTRGQMGEFLAGIFSSMAQLELATIRENWASARSRAVARGVHVASRTPTGYQRREDGRLEPGRGAEQIGEIFRAKARGASWSDLARILEGVPTPYGSPYWTGRSLTHLISNRVYLGEARSGEFVNAGAHQALVDEETWELAQRTKQPRQTGSGGALLSGLLRCAGCRYVLKPDHMRGRDGERLRLYRCRGPRAQGRCPSPASVLGRVVEPFVVEEFFDHLGDVMADAVKASAEQRDLEEVAERAQAELVAYRDSAAAEILGSEFEGGLQARAGRLEDARRALDAVRDASDAVDLPDAPTLRAAWSDLTISEQRHLLRLGMDAVFLRSTGRSNTPVEERALILWRGEAPADLPGPGRRGDSIRGFDWPR